MTGIRNGHHSVVATACAVVVGLAGVLLFVRFQAPDGPEPIAPAAAVRSGSGSNAGSTAKAGNTGNGVRPAPGFEQSPEE